MIIKAILFDINGTLIDIHTDEANEEIYRGISHILTYQGISMHRREVREEYYRIMEAQRKASPEKYPEFDVVELFREFVNRHLPAPGDIPPGKLEWLPLFLAEVAPPPRVESRKVERQVRDAMVSMGYCEVMSYSFASAQFANSIGYRLEGAVELANPISSDLPVLRRSLVPNLLLFAAKNALHRDDFRFFEVGRVFFPSSEGAIPRQERRVAGLIYSRRGDGFELYRKAKGQTERLLTSVGRGEARFDGLDPDSQPPWIGLPVASQIMVEGDKAGVVSLLNPVVRDRLKLRGRVALFELNLEPLMARPENVVRFVPTPRFPSVQNDLSVIVDLCVSHQQVVDIIRSAGEPLLQQTLLFATFRGNPIPEGKKSLSFHLRFSSSDRTLTEEDVQPLLSGILARLQSEVGGEIREA